MSCKYFETLIFRDLSFGGKKFHLEIMIVLLLMLFEHYKWMNLKLEMQFLETWHTIVIVMV